MTYSREQGSCETNMDALAVVPAKRVRYST
jgi:hypothetical protein